MDFTAFLNLMIATLHDDLNEEIEAAFEKAKGDDGYVVGPGLQGFLTGHDTNHMLMPGINRVEAGEMVFEAAQWSGKEKLGFEEWKMAMNQTPLHAREQPTADRTAEEE